MFPDHLIMGARLILGDCADRRLKIATAESCTGGLIAACLTEVAGSSKVVERAFVVYSNRAKEDMLGVPGDVIADSGAVSEAVVRMMAEGALKESRANISIAVTGIAGPGGGTPMKPIGTVHLAAARENHAIIHEMHQFGDIGRSEIRLRTVEAAFELLRRIIDEKSASSGW
jgi:nicotinamide-nucleotide amidase